MRRMWMWMWILVLGACGDEEGRALAWGDAVDNNTTGGAEHLPCPQPDEFVFGGCEIECVGFDALSQESCWIWGDQPDVEVCYPSRFEGGVLTIIDREGPYGQDRARCITAAMEASR